MADLRRTEKEVQHATKQLYGAVGGFVYDLSQPRRTMQTEGLVDLFVFIPHVGTAIAHEVKAEGGRMTPAQVRFAQLVGKCPRLVHVVGGELEARRLLTELRVLFDVRRAPDAHR